MLRYLGAVVIHRDFMIIIRILLLKKPLQCFVYGDEEFFRTPRARVCWGEETDQLERVWGYCSRTTNRHFLSGTAF